jgi:hypothetical protein
MTKCCKSLVLLFSIFLAGCSLGQLSLIPLDGSQTTDLAQVALVREDPNHPALLRGLDGVFVHSFRVPKAFEKYSYVMSAGSHTFWLKGSPYPLPVLPQRIRCYTLHAVLVQGMRYCLKEDEGSGKALLIMEGTGETVATGDLVDEPWIFIRDCRW